MSDLRGNMRTGEQQHLRRLASILAAAALLGGSAPAQGEERPAPAFTLKQVRAAVEEHVGAR